MPRVLLRLARTEQIFQQTCLWHTRSQCLCPHLQELRLSLLRAQPLDATMAPKAMAMAKRGDRIPEVRMSKHLLTSNARMYPTKDGKWTRTSIETKTWDDLADYFNADTSESRNRPAIGLSTFAGTLSLMRKELKDLRAMNIYGAGVDFIIKELDQLAPVLDILNSFGPDVARDDETVQSAVTEAPSAIA